MKKRHEWNLALLLAFVFLISSMLPASAQTTKSIVYELGESEVNLMLRQSAYEGASPAELEGLRQGFEQQLAETPVIIMLRDDGILVIQANGDSHELKYVRNGLKLMAQNVQTGEFIQFGFFSKDGSTLTLSNGTILDKKE